MELLLRLRLGSLRVPSVVIERAGVLLLICLLILDLPCCLIGEVLRGKHRLLDSVTSLTAGRREELLGLRQCLLVRRERHLVSYLWSRPLAL